MLGSLSLVAGPACCGGGAAKGAASAKNAKPQTLCPVTGEKIDKSLYADVKGYRVYVCCKGCIAKVKADPDKYLAKIKADGETPAKSPLCPKCGEVKGSAKCCDPKAAKCPSCGKIKGSPGCCK